MKELFDFETTNDTLFKGKLKFTQPKEGFRFGVDALLLAAAVPAKGTDHILDLGCGVGAVTFCLAHRCPSVKVTGLEIQPHLAALAHHNASQNSMEERVTIIEGDITSPPAALKEPAFDHVVMNPPYMTGDDHNTSPHRSKEIAHTEINGSLADWIKTSRRALKPKGTLSIIHRTDRMNEILPLLGKGFGDIRLIPLWPREGQPSKRIIIRATKGSRAPLTLTPGLIIHEKGQQYTNILEGIVTAAEPLDI